MVLLSFLFRVRYSQVPMSAALMMLLVVVFPFLIGKVLNQIGEAYECRRKAIGSESFHSL